MKKFGVSLFLGALVSSGVAFALETQTKSMSFEACLATIREVSSALETAPINIVETNILRVVRFVTADGSVLVSCSQPDNKMIVMKSD
jgi:hypothetical protein